MLNSEFNAFANNQINLAPPELLSKMQEFDVWIYPNINDGVYKCGFAKTQRAYDDAVDNLFNALDRLEVILGKSRYLCGNTLTLSDIRLFVTLVRFDEVYFVHFKCNKRLIREYPNLFNHTKDVYQLPGVSDSVNMKHIKMHYYSSHTSLNALGIIPKGVPVEWGSPHDRSRFSE